MLFSDLIDYLKNEKTFNIILNCSTDLHEIRDVEQFSIMLKFFSFFK